MKILCVMAGLIIYLILPSSFAAAQSSEDISISKEILREIIQLKIQVARLEEGQKALDKRMDDMQGWMQIIVAGMIGLVGFILWDRRTAIMPVVKRTTELEKELAAEKEMVGKLVVVMKEYAKKEPQFTEMLKTAGVLGTCS